jgi:hypothetical protein
MQTIQKLKKEIRKKLIIKGKKNVERQFVKKRAWISNFSIFGFFVSNNPFQTNDVECKMFNASLNSLKDSNVSLKMKIIEEGIKVRSLAYSTSGVRRACWSFGMGTKMNDKRVNYSH